MGNKFNGQIVFLLLMCHFSHRFRRRWRKKTLTAALFVTCKSIWLMVY